MGSTVNASDALAGDASPGVATVDPRGCVRPGPTAAISCVNENPQLLQNFEFSANVALQLGQIASSENSSAWGIANLLP